MKRKNLFLEGLIVWVCYKIENALNKVEGISSANINFVKSKFNCRNIQS